MPANKNEDWFKKKKKVKQPKETKKAKENKQPKESKKVSSKVKLPDANADVKKKNRELKDSSAFSQLISKIGAYLNDALTFLAIPFSKGPLHRVIQKAKSKTLLMKILYTLVILAIFRIGTSITMPGITFADDYKASVAKSDSFLGVMDMMGGGGLRNFSVLALGVSPSITASIIVQLLTSEAIPALHKWQTSGPVGKRKINIFTRWLTLFFGILQAITIMQQFVQQDVTVVSSFNSWQYKFIAIPAVLVAGTLFTMFLGEQITQKGIGNGTTLIIFSGIAFNLPYQFRTAFVDLVQGNSGNSNFIGSLNFLIYVAVFLFLIWLIGFLYIAERKIPIQQTGAGLQKEKSEISHLPIKLNPAGVMPIIFSLALATLPLTIVQFMHHQNEGRIWVEQNMKLTDAIGLSIFIFLNFLFTIAISFVTFNPYQITENFKKSSTFIPGVRPGDETEKYLSGIVLRLGVFSAVYLSLLCALQYFEQIMGLSAKITFAGTSMIILVMAAIETVGQFKVRDKTQKIAVARKKIIANQKKDDLEETGGLLW